MVATTGRKQITFTERKQLYRKTPRKIRDYGNDTISPYKDLINSFTSVNYREYEKMLNVYGCPGRKKQVLLDACLRKDINGPILEMAKIRVNDLKLHQKLVQALRHRWTTKSDSINNKINESPEKFWESMAAAIQYRSKEKRYGLCEEWEGTAGRILLTNFLKTQYEKQNKLCAISKLPMSLEKGKRNPNKCSPDRKNSNIGYTPKNLWLVTSWVNSMKLDTPLITFWNRVDQLSKARQYNLIHNKNKPRYSI